jgi:hypothetical protein
MFIIITLINTFFASWTLFELSCFVTLSEQVLIICRYLYNLFTVLALSKHLAVLPEMDIQVLLYWEFLVNNATELTFYLFIFLWSHSYSLFLLLRAWLTSTNCTLCTYICCYCFFLRRWRSLTSCTLSIIRINPIYLTKSILQQFNLSLSKTSEVTSDFWSNAFIDF